MAKFAKPEKQAAAVMKQLQGSVIKSVGTVRNFEQALTTVSNYCRQMKLPSLRAMKVDDAITYLELRGQLVGQKALDLERQALQKMMHHVSKVLPENQRLPVIKSEQQQVLKSRAYTDRQVEMVASKQQASNALATQISYAAGLRAHELFTLARYDERSADNRPANSHKWTGRSGTLYTVQGKGGLIRQVLLPANLATELELHRRAQPVTVRDRDINYLSRYNIAGGQRWSNSFSAASKRALDWSRGAHGLRHSYAQQRMYELQMQGLTRGIALETVSQEMGHFRPEITETYLR
ncbi:site-specific integrase [Alkalimonas sp. MEB108]|uniref:Site-specific integrase n=1 Tax=Alkalimonas cellulosilytica TaxID=3058395 RepID=A0ABU7J4J0_9GAMM|nr:site-specific integrase [Alkalimonas sp. MEB108]MEE2001409.1 site-specific integrase [Alkalimonas sp. MEB108]